MSARASKIYKSGTKYTRNAIRRGRTLQGAAGRGKRSIALKAKTRLYRQGAAATESFRNEVARRADGVRPLMPEMMRAPMDLPRLIENGN